MTNGRPGTAAPSPQPSPQPSPPWSVSAVIPARDAERYLGETIESILAQTLAVQEVVVVDDGSTDGTAAVAASFGDRVRVVSIPASGTATARNVGVAAATGDVIAFCDADDVWDPTKLEKQAALLPDPRDAVAVFSGMREFWSPDLDPSARVGREPRPDVTLARLASAVLLTRPAIAATGPFPDGALEGEWLAWCTRLCDVVEVRHVPEALFSRRLHDRNSSLQSRDRPRLWTAALHERVRARRTVAER